MELKDKKCVPCSSYVPPLPLEDKERMTRELGGDWLLTENGRRLFRSFKFKSFKRPLALTNEIARIAEEENHHPEIRLGWGHCDVEIWTHSNDNLVENDFILAAKISEAYLRLFPPA